MGEPVLRDPFDPDRWDYVYSVQVGNVVYQQLRMSLFFDERLARKIQRRPGTDHGRAKRNGRPSSGPTAAKVRAKIRSLRLPASAQPSCRHRVDRKRPINLDAIPFVEPLATISNDRSIDADGCALPNRLPRIRQRTQRAPTHPRSSRRPATPVRRSAARRVARETTSTRIRSCGPRPVQSSRTGAERIHHRARGMREDDPERPLDQRSRHFEVEFQLYFAAERRKRGKSPHSGEPFERPVYQVQFDRTGIGQHVARCKTFADAPFHDRQFGDHFCVLLA